MAYDGITVACVVKELKEKLLGGRIDKVTQPEKDELVISVRSGGGNYKLLLSANASAPRMCLCEEKHENPALAPLFCMVLRKQIQGGRITDIIQPNFERIIEIVVDSRNEMGDQTEKRLVTEIMGKHSNIMLVSDGAILDSIKHVSIDQSRVRPVLPGLKYQAAPSQNKLNPLEFEPSEFLQRVESAPGTKAQNIIYQSYTGISPLAAGELCFRSGISATGSCGGLSGGEKQRLAAETDLLCDDLRADVFRPVMVYEIGKPSEFAAHRLTMYEGQPDVRIEEFDSVSAMLERFYAEFSRRRKAESRQLDLKKSLKLHIERAARKKELNAAALDEVSRREELRVCGELIRANIYAVAKGQSKLSAFNYFDEQGGTLDIELDKDLSPSENMQKYFKQYNKQKRTHAAALVQLDAADKELYYLESVLSSLDECRTAEDIDAVRQELYAEGYLKRKAVKGKQPKRQAKKLEPLEYRSSDGLTILVGRNNAQNDELTLRTALPSDMWFHTKNIPGSHVILRCAGQAPPETSVLEAAKLAAYHSQVKGEAATPVDYCLRKYVKKPSGARPGMVIYETNKTAYVGCGRDEAEKLSASSLF